MTRYAPRQDSDDADESPDFSDHAPEAELDFNRERGRDLFDERDIDESDDEDLYEDEDDTFESYDDDLEY